MTANTWPISGSLLLTGATGRLGRAVLELLTPEALDLRALVLPADPAAAELSRLGLSIFSADLAAGHESLESATQGVDAVIHMAAQLPRPGVTPQQLFESIVAGTFHLLESLATSSPRARFIYVSSSAVYGPQLPALIDPITEDHPIRPTSVYAAAKVAAETMVESYGRSHGLRPTIIRPSDIVVPEDVLSPEGFVGRRLEMRPARRTVGVPVDSDGRSTTLSVASARDVARGILMALSEDAAVGSSYHIGPVESPSDRDIASAIARLRQWDVEELEPTEEIRRWVLDTGKARAELGFEARDDIDAILRKD